MSSRMVPIFAAFALAASASALAQTPTDRTFTATGTQCQDVSWSSETLARYPRIAESCRAVVERDGKYFVVFAGTVKEVARGGRELTVDFKDGDRVTLNPPPDMKFDINGEMTRARDLEPGTELTFYVPQDRFVAEELEGETVSEVPISGWEEEQPEESVAQEARPSELPQTGTQLGLLALGGLGLLATGATLTAARYRRRAD